MVEYHQLLNASPTILAIPEQVSESKFLQLGVDPVAATSRALAACCDIVIAKGVHGVGRTAVHPQAKRSSQRLRPRHEPFDRSVERGVTSATDDDREPYGFAFGFAPLGAAVWLTFWNFLIPRHGILPSNLKWLYHLRKRNIGDDAFFEDSKSSTGLCNRSAETVA
jgi:hypothetical protein